MWPPCKLARCVLDQTGTGQIETTQRSQWWSSSRAQAGKSSCQVDSAADIADQLVIKLKFIRIQFFPEENNIVLSNKCTSINGIICVINTSAISQNMFKIDFI